MAIHRQALGGLRALPPDKTQGSLWLRRYHHVTNVAKGGPAHLLLVAPPLPPPPPPLTLLLLPLPPPCLAFVGLRKEEFWKELPLHAMLT